MRRGLFLAAMIAAAAAGAAGQGTNALAAGNAAAAAAKPQASAEIVKVYEPRKPVIPPRLLAMDKPPAISKHCSNPWIGEPELSLLVDTEGRARNIIFLNPTGTVVDRLAVAIASEDRFAPGTLDGKPVVVAESLKVKIEACAVGQEKVAAGVEQRWALRRLPRQKLKKPKNPPEVAKLAPLKTLDEEMARVVMRPDFFGEGESAPVLLYSEYADYTPSRPGTKGTCQVSLVVDAHGLPQNLYVLKKLDPGLDLSALVAVERYRFFPAIKGDRPVPAAVVVSVNFEPPQ